MTSFLYIYFLIYFPTEIQLASIKDDYIIKYNSALSNTLKPVKTIQRDEDLDCLISCSRSYSCNSVSFSNKSCKMYPLIYNLLQTYIDSSYSDKIFIKKNSMSK